MTAPERDPHTGRALPRRIPAVPRQSRGEVWALAVLAGVGAGVYIWLIATVLSGGAL